MLATHLVGGNESCEVGGFLRWRANIPEKVSLAGREDPLILGTRVDQPPRHK